MSSYQQALDGAIRSYGILAPYLSELIAMRHGLRTAIQITVAPAARFERHRAALEGFCARTGFHLMTMTRNRALKVLVATVAELPALHRETFELEPACGRLFGYPECCVERFLALPGGAQPLVNDMWELVEPEERFSFLMNPFLRTTPFNLLKHYPCSLECRKSKDYAERVLSLVRRDNPALHDDIVRFNRGPALFLDMCGAGIMFAGTMADDGAINYREAFWAFHPSSVIGLSSHNRREDCALFDAIVVAVSRGDRLILDESELTVTSRGRSLNVFSRPDHLRWKTLCFE